MNKIKWFFSFIFLFLLLVTPVSAQQVCQQQDPCANISSVQDRASCYEAVVNACKNTRQTLSSQINYMNNQIRLTTLRIENTKTTINKLAGEIGELGDEINRLEGILTKRSELILRRIPEAYKRSVTPQFGLLLFSRDFTDFIARAKYLVAVQEEDAMILFQVKATQNNFNERKQVREEKKKQFEQAKRELEQQNLLLTQQKRDKQALLEETENNETKYQGLLASARAEIAVASGLGTETFLRNTSEGEIIGRVIPSASGCSSGQHLHFEVHQNDTVQDPNNFLKNISFSYSYGSDRYSYYGTINPHGSWNWPMEEPIVINQGFGNHSFAKNFYPGGVHNGIDIDSKTSTAVKAVKGGKLYGGTYQCTGYYAGTLLYAKVDQGDGMTAWYLHMTPQ